MLGAFIGLVWFFDLKNLPDGSLSLIKSLLLDEEPAEPLHPHFLIPVK